MTVHQKLGIILENKVAQKLKQENDVFTQTRSYKLIFLNLKKDDYRCEGKINSYLKGTRNGRDRNQ